MRKQLFTLILAAFGGMSSAFAYDFSALCPTGQTLYYNIIDAVNHEVELTHPNNNENFPWEGYTLSEGRIIMPETVIYDGTTFSVTSIGHKAFYGCAGLSDDLIIPNSVTTIGESAFERCYGFTGNLVIPNSVKKIGKKAFASCLNFTGNLVIPNSVTEIGEDAFYSCLRFDGGLVIPNSVTSIGKGAFCNCYGFTGNLVIPNSVTRINGYAFANCEGFTGNLTIPDSVTEIGEYAFNGCHGFTGNLVIPNSVTVIGEHAFDNCFRFTGDLIIPNSVTAIGECAFNNCHGFTGDLVISNSMTFIWAHTFYNCHGFTGNLVIPNSVESINREAFYCCRGFTGDLVIPNSVTSVEENAFFGCSGLTGDLTIPNTAFYFGWNCFSSCGFSSVTYNVNGWIDSNPSFPLFDDCPNLKKLTIGQDVKKVPYCLFYGCDKVESITVESYYPPTIETYAFYGISTTIPVYVPPCTISLYQHDRVWRMFNNYQQGDYYELTVKSNYIELGCVTIIQQPDCEHDVIVEATPNGNTPFSGWMENGVIISTENPYQFTLTKDTHLEACFGHYGVNDNETPEISLYPNPTNGIFTIKGEEDIDKIEVYNAQGQLVISQTVSDDFVEIDLSNAVNGLYLVRMTSDAGVMERTVVKR